MIKLWRVLLAVPIGIVAIPAVGTLWSTDPLLAFVTACTYAAAIISALEFRRKD